METRARGTRYVIASDATRPTTMQRRGGGKREGRGGGGNQVDLKL